jgi:hypothetical protein
MISKAFYNTIISYFKERRIASLLITTFTFEELIPAMCCIAPEIPMAIYKFSSLVFQSVLRVLREVSIPSETGFEQAVAAPTVANSSPFPIFRTLTTRPAETTIQHQQ